MLEKNLKLLKDRNIDFEVVDVDNNMYITFQAKNKSKAIKVFRDNKTIHFHSTYNPEQESKKFINSFYEMKEKIIIIFGLGFFYHIKEIVNKLPKESVLFLYEPDEYVFMEAVKNIDLEEILQNENVNILVNNNNKNLRDGLKEVFDWINIDNFSIHIMPAYNVLYRTVYKDFMDTIDKLYTADKLNQNTIIKFREKWQQNMIDNLNFTLNSYSVFELTEKLKTFNDLPFVIVSAGPSLDDCIEELKTLKNKACILCVYTALRKLLDNGIEPDFVFTIDGNQTMHEKVVRSFNSNLLAMATSDTRLLKAHKGKQYMFFSGQDKFFLNQHSKYGKETVFLSLYGTVASMALSFAINCEAKVIIFVGQDFAFSGGQTHAKGTFYDDVEEKPDNTRFYVDGYNGKVLTENAFNSYRIYFENFIENYKDIMFINTSSKGAIIKNTQFLNIKDAINKYVNKEFALDEIKTNKIFTSDEKKQIIDELGRIVDKTNCIISLIEENIRDCYKFIKIYSKSNIGNSKTNNIIKKLEVNDVKIGELEKEDSFFYAIYQNLILEIYNDEKESDLDIIKKSLNFYEKLKQQLIPVNKELEKKQLELLVEYNTIN